MMPGDQRERVIHHGVLSAGGELWVAVRPAQLHVPVVQFRNHAWIKSGVLTGAQPECNRQLAAHLQAGAFAYRAIAVRSAEPISHAVVAGPPGGIIESRCVT